MKKLILSIITVFALLFTSVVTASASSNDPKTEQVTQHKQLKLSKDNKVVAGVCGGIAEYFGWDPTVVRIAWVILDLCYGVGIVAYVIAWVLMS